MARKLIKNVDVVTLEEGELLTLKGVNIIINGREIEALESGEIKEGDFARVIDGAGKVAVPGFINTHTHAVLDTLFRGITDDFNREKHKGSAIYGLVIPMMNIAEEILDMEERNALIRLGLLEMLKSGATTIVEQAVWEVEPYLDILQEIKMRACLGPNVKSVFPEAEGEEIKYVGDASKAFTALEDNLNLFKKHNGSLEDRLRIRIGLHAPDTCSPEVIQRARQLADDCQMGLNIHLAQSQVEIDTMMERYGRSPVEYLNELGLLGSDLIAAHCVFLNENDIRLLAETGTNIAHCPLVFAKGGIHPPFYPLKNAGANLTIGTDSYTMDYFSEMRSAALLGKLETRAAHKVTARDVFKAGTINGARAIGRDDLGVLAAGKKADINLLDFNNAFMAPRWDEVANIVWSGNPMMIDTILINGEVVVSEGRAVGLDEEKITADAQQVADKVWKLSEKEGILRRENYGL